MQDARRRARRRQALVFVFLMLLLSLVLILLSLSLNPSLKFASREFWSGFARDIGFVFAPAAVLTLIYESLADSNTTGELSGEVSALIRAEFAARLPAPSTASDVVNVYNGRSEIDFNNYWRSAQRNIDILVTNLQTMQMQLGALLARARAGVEVRILAINPDHTFVVNRFAELSLKQSGEFRLELITSLRQFCIEIEREGNLTEEERKRVVCKIYDNPPTIMLFRSDDRVIASYILRQGRARDYPHLEFAVSREAPSGGVAGALLGHFDAMWKEASVVTYERVEDLSHGAAGRAAARSPRRSGAGAAVRESPGGHL